MDQGGSARTLVDSRGAACPGPITDLALACRGAKAGDVVELWATDPAVKPDLQAWAAKTGNRILSVDDEADRIVALVTVVSA